MTNQDISLALKGLKDELNEEPIIKRYYEIKTLMDNNSELQELSLLVRTSQKEMVQSIGNKDEHLRKKEIYENYKSRYDNHPLMIEYNNIIDEVYSLLKQIANIIND